MIENVLFWTLKGSAICAIAFATTILLRRSPAAVRHAIWIVAICAQLLLPFSRELVPQHRLELHVPLPSPTVLEPVPQADKALPHATEHGFDWRRLVPWIFIAGIVAVLLRLAAGTLVVIAITLKASRVTEGEWLAALQSRCADLRIARPVTLLWTSRLALPVTWGFFYPIVLLPLSAVEWSEERRDHVLLHELAHIKRADALTQLAGQLAAAMYWFNPLIWFSVRRMRAEAENACDDYVLRGGGAPSMYAMTLVRLIEAHHGEPVPAFASLSVGRRSDLEKRVAAITRSGRDASVRRTLLATSVACMAALVLPLSAIQRAIAMPSLTSACIPLTAPDFTGSGMSGTLSRDGVTTHYFFQRDDRCMESSFSLDTEFTDDDRDIARGSGLVREGSRAAYMTGNDVRFTVDGKPAAWDRAAQRWYHDLMPEIILHTTAGVVPRVRRILQSGEAAFISELERIPQPSVRYRYLLAADALPRSRVIELAERYLTYEPERANFLTKVARRDVMDDLLRATFALRDRADQATVIESLLSHRDPVVRNVAAASLGRLPEEWQQKIREDIQ